MKFYRYEVVNYSFEKLIAPMLPSIVIELRELSLVKETLNGYWIAHGFTGGKLRSHAHWIPKESKKRYAYLTKEEAIENFIARIKRRKKIVDWQSEICRISLNLAVVLKSQL